MKNWKMNNTGARTLAYMKGELEIDTNRPHRNVVPNHMIGKYLLKSYKKYYKNKRKNEN